MPPSLSLLQEEIQQCKVLMRLLAERLGHLEGALAAFSSPQPGEEHSFPLPDAERQVRNPHFPYLNGQRQVREPHFLYPTEEGQLRKQHFPYPDSERPEWNPHFPYQTGERQVRDPCFPYDGGKGQNLNLPQEKNLSAVLRKEEKGLIRRTALRSTARLLLHLCTQPAGNSHQKIAAMFGQSVSGTSKLLGMIRRRGLIERTGWQQYRPTAKACGYMQQAAEMA